MALVLRKSLIARNLIKFKNIKARHLSGNIIKRKNIFCKRLSTAYGPRTTYNCKKRFLSPSREPKTHAPQYQYRAYHSTKQILKIRKSPNKLIINPIRSYTCKTPCCPPCFTPAGGASLPPPCNCQAKCIQYQTGYYYYPYGFWFCGPYHVATCNSSCPPQLSKFCACICPNCTNIASKALKDDPKMAGAKINMAMENSEPAKPRVRSTLSKLLPFTSNMPPSKLKEKHVKEGCYAFNHTLECNCAICVKEMQGKKSSTVVNPPRQLPTQSQRDNPVVERDKFSFASAPCFNNPFPNLKNPTTPMAKNKNK